MMLHISVSVAAVSPSDAVRRVATSSITTPHRRDGLDLAARCTGDSERDTAQLLQLESALDGVRVKSQLAGGGRKRGEFPQFLGGFVILK